MKSHTIKMFIFVIFTILLNYFGKLFAETLSLPFWFDSLGTVLAAYVLGPFCGAVVGVSCNVIYGVVYSPLNILYAFVSIFISIIVCFSGSVEFNPNESLIISTFTTVESDASIP